MRGEMMFFPSIFQLGVDSLKEKMPFYMVPAIAVICGIAQIIQLKGDPHEE